MAWRNRRGAETSSEEARSYGHSAAISRSAHDSAYDPTMIRLRRGVVVQVADTRPGLLELSVEINGSRDPALAYPALTGPVTVGDTVVLNTTARASGLGSGGYHFVVAVEGQDDQDPPAEGHIIKMRYTPHQAKVLAIEEQSSPDRAALQATEDLGGLPVAWLPLHSMLGVAAAGAKTAGAARVAYVMTDGAALPLWVSRQVEELRAAELIDSVITAGQALGGDYEAVNLFSALLGARAICDADVVLVGDGVGKVGTDTRWGASDVSAGMALNAAAILRGRPIAALRINFADPLYRHYGVSPHSITVLSRVAQTPVDVALPILAGKQRALVRDTLRDAGIEDRHRLIELDGDPAVSLLQELGVGAQTMGRSLAEEPAFFSAAGAAGALAAQLAGAPAAGPLEESRVADA